MWKETGVGEGEPLVRGKFDLMVDFFFFIKSKIQGAYVVVGSAVKLDRCI